MRHLWDLFEDRWLFRYKTAGLSRSTADWMINIFWRPILCQKNTSTHGTEYSFSKNYLFRHFLSKIYSHCTELLLHTFIFYIYSLSSVNGYLVSCISRVCSRYSVILSCTSWQRKCEDRFPKSNASSPSCQLGDNEQSSPALCAFISFPDTVMLSHTVIVGIKLVHAGQL